MGRGVFRGGHGRQRGWDEKNADRKVGLKGLERDCPRRCLMLSRV